MRLRLAFIWLVALAAVALVTALLVVRFVRFDGGPLDRYAANGFGTAWPSDVALGLGMLELHNDSDHAVVIDRVTLGPHTPGIRYLGTLLAQPDCHNSATTASFPPRSPGRCRYTRADNVTLAPNVTVEGFVGIRAPTGKYRIHGVVVDYERRLFAGVTLRMRAHAGIDWATCMTPNWPHALCKPPRV